MVFSKIKTAKSGFFIWKNQKPKGKNLLISLPTNNVLKKEKNFKQQQQNSLRYNISYKVRWFKFVTMIFYKLPLILIVADFIGMFGSIPSISPSRSPTAKFTISSSAFEADGVLPDLYNCNSNTGGIDERINSLSIYYKY